MVATTKYTIIYNMKENNITTLNYTYHNQRISGTRQFCAIQMSLIIIIIITIIHGIILFLCDLVYQSPTKTYRGLIPDDVTIRLTNKTCPVRSPETSLYIHLEKQPLNGSS